MAKVLKVKRVPDGSVSLVEDAGRYTVIGSWDYNDSTNRRDVGTDRAGAVAKFNEAVALFGQF